MIDLYCERVGPGLLAEPLNAATNGLFLVAAGLCWMQARGRTDVHGLALLLAAIAIGSALFHTFATAWAQWLDVVPILVFQLTYLWLYPRRCLELGRSATVIGLLLYGATIAGASQFPHALNGSAAYLPAAGAVFLIGCVHFRSRCAGRALIIVASALFVLSLAARTVDNAWCAQWPLGTHWLWHSLNALVLYLLIRAYTQRVSAAQAAVSG